MLPGAGRGVPEPAKHMKWTVERVAGLRGKCKRILDEAD